MAGERIPEWEKLILDPPQHAAGLTDVRCLRTVGSTMDEARAMLPVLSQSSRALVLAESQEQGRGRQGRGWSQPEVGFYGTFALPAVYGVGAVVGFSLAVGVALARFVHALGGECKLKWPNDVVSPAGAKLSGVLIELVTSHDLTWVLTGIGVNLAGAPVLSVPTTDLRALTGQAISVPEAARAFSPLLLQVWKDFTAGGFPLFRKEWLSLAYRLHEVLQVDTGSEKISGEFIDVSERGCLILDTGSRTVEIISGHVVGVGESTAI